MHRRTTTAIAGVFAVTLSLGVAGAAQAQGQNCDDFTYQEDAQAAYDKDTSDPDGLDGPAGTGYSGKQGVACEELPSRGGSTPAEETTAPDDTQAPGYPEGGQDALDREREANADQTTAPGHTTPTPSRRADEDKVVPDTSRGVDTGGW